MDKNVAEVVEPNNCVVGCDMCMTDCLADAISSPEKKALAQALRTLRQE